MAGRRQHTIPRFLLKAFGQRERNDFFVWMYRKGESAKYININRVGIDRDFYGREGGVNADPQITDAEPEFADLMHQLRSDQNVGPTRDQRIAKLIAHMSIRTRSLRQSFEDGFNFLLDELVGHLKKKETLRELLKGTSFRNQFTRDLVARGASLERATLLAATIEPWLPQVLDNMMPEAVNAIEASLRAVKSKVPRAMREGHIRALVKDPAPERRVARYASLNWYVLGARTPLILGDTACIFETGGKRRFKPLDDDGDTLERVLLPLSRDRLLVGSARDTAPELDSWGINKASAKSSYEYFVSSVPLPAGSALIRLLGQEAGVLCRDELRSMVAEIKASIGSN